MQKYSIICIEEEFADELFEDELFESIAAVITPTAKSATISSGTSRKIKKASYRSELISLSFLIDLLIQNNKYYEIKQKNKTNLYNQH